MNSFQTMLLLAFITRAGTDADAAFFVMVYAAGNLLLNIGKYGVRQFQVTDSAGQYAFRDYAGACWIPLTGMAAAVAVHILTGILFRGYSSTKAAVMLLICVYKGTEAAERILSTGGCNSREGWTQPAGSCLSGSSPS